MNKQKHISIRIDEEVLKKFHYVSRYNGRSASGQILYLINQCIREFEKEQGEIELERPNPWFFSPICYNNEVRRVRFTKEKK